MIVERRTYKAKYGQNQAAAEFARQAQETLGYSNLKRTYTPISGPNNIVCQEFEFKDWQEREDYWAAFFALPQIPEWIETWSTMVDPGGTTEFLTLVD